MLMRGISFASLVAGWVVCAPTLPGAEATMDSGDRPPVSKPTPTVEEGMPLFSSDELSEFFQEIELPEKKEHPIFVGKDDDVVEMETFNVYSDKLTLRQSLEERISDSEWASMKARMEELDPEQTALDDYDKRSSERFFSTQSPGAAADRPDPGGIEAKDAYEATVKAVRGIYGP